MKALFVSFWLPCLRFEVPGHYCAASIELKPERLGFGMLWWLFLIVVL